MIQPTNFVVTTWEYNLQYLLIPILSRLRHHCSRWSGGTSKLSSVGDTNVMCITFVTGFIISN